MGFIYYFKLSQVLQLRLYDWEIHALAEYLNELPSIALIDPLGDGLQN